jgi:hypothetical protein
MSAVSLVNVGPLSSRHVQNEEALRLGIQSGWYTTKVSGTFVTGPHTTQEECTVKIRELNPPSLKRKI